MFELSTYIRLIRPFIEGDSSAEAFTTEILERWHLNVSDEWRARSGQPTSEEMILNDKLEQGDLELPEYIEARKSLKRKFKMYRKLSKRFPVAFEELSALHSTASVFTDDESLLLQCYAGESELREHAKEGACNPDQCRI